jgi:hypothetical protein
MSDETSRAEEQGDTGCTRCDAPLIFLGQQQFHEGDSAFGFLLGSMQELFEDRLDLEMWACRDCGHVEFFMPLKERPKD